MSCEDSMIPDECKMPDISDLKFPLKTYLIVHAMIGNKGITKKEKLYRLNFVRLVDKAIMAYDEARDTILAQIKEAKRPLKKMIKHGRILHILGFTDHFENCINAPSRLLRQLDVIKSDSCNWLISRRECKSIKAYSRSIPNIRNAAEHMECDIREDKITDKPVMLSIGGMGDKAVLGEYEIKFTEVATALRGLHQIACDLFKSKE